MIITTHNEIKLNNIMIKNKHKLTINIQTYIE